VPQRIAVITTVYRYLSHAQHEADRFLAGYPRNGRWHKPDARIVSMYVDQKPAGDLSEARAREFGFTVYPTIAGALRCGGEKLAVDGVLLIGGGSPFAFFKQIVEVFEKEGRAVPVFNDGQLSSSFGDANWIVEASRHLKFPMLAGSSLPVTWRLPDIELPPGCEIEEALMVGVGGPDPMDYHALEAMQCMVERRKGGETGVRAVQLIEGDAVWQAGEAGRWSKRLLTAALSRSDTPMGLTVKDGRTQDLVGSGELRRLAAKPAAYFIEYNDGLKATLLMVSGAVRDFNFAARVKGMGVQSTQFLLTPEPNVTYSACLMAKVEEMFTTGRAPYPVERTLLVSGVLESCLTSRVEGQRRLETPHLGVRYRAPKEPQHARG
jgi:hypothetical protein